MKLWALLFSIIFSSCTKNNLDLEESSNLSLIFTGNVNAEIEPCGCRQFPLGGIDNVYGALSSEKKSSSVLFVDTGDSYYQASFIPESEEESTKEKARSVHLGFNLVDLKLKLIGDQDLSSGFDDLKELIKDSKYEILVSNLNKPDFPHIEYKTYTFHQHRLFFLGVVNPETIQASYRSFFSEPEASIKRMINNLTNTEKFDSKNPYHHLIVLSHSGQKLENQYANTFEAIDWILGSHSMNFTQKPNVIKKTRLAQMLSRNHYLGKISFIKDDPKTTYSTIEINQQLANKVKNNPLISFIEERKKITDKILVTEQSKNSEEFYNTDQIPTASACIDCHDAQGTFWQKTSHSLAYITLKNSTRHHDLDCLKCHSLGTRDKKGYVDSKKIVIVEKQEDYWKEVFSKAAPSISLRELAESEIHQHSKAWYDLDLKYNVSHNYANVQCLNCHQQNIEHLNNPSAHKGKNVEKIKNACLSCHTSDQSTHWYSNNKLIEETFQKMYVKMSCPKITD